MTDTRHRTFLYLLPLLLLACTLTERLTHPPNDTGSVVIAQTVRPTEQTQTASFTPAPLMCHVHTGIEAGKLNLRTCGSTECPVLIVLHEGETLTQTKQAPVSGWIQVITTAGLRGWLNSNYTDCPARDARLK